jgi:alkanesulfonate monooxygenase SsuD/methylene tetrahydromethanopterin reductase-like flavin-dependent oxidoreductase (luciferase family)
VSRDESRERFEEGLAIMRKAWTSERFSYDGRFYQIPEIALTPRPIQQPHPPLWVAANSPDTAEFAGRQGLDILVASPINPLPKMFEHVARYREKRAHGGHHPLEGKVATTFFSCPAETLAQARALFEPSVMHYFRTIGEQAMLGDQGQYEGSYQYLRQVRERALSIRWDEIDETMGLFGPPDECAARINRVFEGTHASQLVSWFNPGGLIPHRQVMASMERFATKVMPVVRSLGA